MLGKDCVVEYLIIAQQLGNLGVVLQSVARARGGVYDDKSVVGDYLLVSHTLLQRCVCKGVEKE